MISFASGDELKVARMQSRRMHAHERYMVQCVPRKGYHCIPVGVISCVERGRQCCLDLDHVLARIEPGDRDCANATRHALVWKATSRRQERKSILTVANLYRVVQSDINGVVAAADRYRISYRTADGDY